MVILYATDLMKFNGICHCIVIHRVIEKYVNLFAVFNPEAYLFSLPLKHLL